MTGGRGSGSFCLAAVRTSLPPSPDPSRKREGRRYGGGSERFPLSPAGGEGWGEGSFSDDSRL